MASVQVDITDTDPPHSQGRQGGGGNPGGAGKGAQRAASAPLGADPGGPDIEMEREVTKRQIIQSVTTVVVVILYMVFTLLRDRDSGVVVVDNDEGADDWQE